MSPRSMTLLQGFITLVSIISLLSGATGFGVFCLLVAMAPSIYDHYRRQNRTTRHHHGSDAR